MALACPRCGALFPSRWALGGHLSFPRCDADPSANGDAVSPVNAADNTENNSDVNTENNTSDNADDHDNTDGIDADEDNGDSDGNDRALVAGDGPGNPNVNTRVACMAGACVF